MRWTRRLFFIWFGVTALIAVGSYWWQFEGLAGEHGIAPIVDGMAGLRANPELGFFEVPTLLWVSAASWVPHALCALCCLAALAMVLGFAPRLASLTLWACWLSLVQVGHPFLAFQWDVLLVETAFCAALYAPPGLRPRWAIEPCARCSRTDRPRRNFCAPASSSTASLRAPRRPGGRAPKPAPIAPR